MLRLIRRAGPFPGEELPAFARRLERLEQAIEPLRILVQDAENRYAVRAQPLTADPLARRNWPNNSDWPAERSTTCCCGRAPICMAWTACAC